MLEVNEFSQGIKIKNGELNLEPLCYKYLHVRKKPLVIHCKNAVIKVAGYQIRLYYIIYLLYIFIIII